MDKNTFYAAITSMVFVFAVISYNSYIDFNIKKKNESLNLKSNNLNQVNIPKRDILLYRNDNNKFANSSNKSNLSQSKTNNNTLNKSNNIINNNIESEYKISEQEFFNIKNDIYSMTFNTLNAVPTNISLISNKHSIETIFNSNTGNISDSDFYPFKIHFSNFKNKKLQNNSIFKYIVYDYNSISNELKESQRGKYSSSFYANNEQYNYYKNLIISKIKKIQSKIENDINNTSSKILLFKTIVKSVNNNKPIEITKIFYIVNNYYILNMQFIFKSINDEILYICDSDSESKCEDKQSSLSRSFYVYWGENIGVKFEKNNKNSYNSTINTSYMKYENSSNYKLKEFLANKNTSLLNNFNSIIMDSRYSLIAFIKNNLQINLHGYIYDNTLNNNKDNDIVSKYIGIGYPPFSLNKDNKFKKQFNLEMYLGYKKDSILSKDIYKGMHLSKVNERSMLSFLKPLEWLVEIITLYIYSITKNLGLSLILLALIVKLITSPLTLKSTESAMKLSKLAPQVKSLEKKYAQDKNLYSQKLMELYKKEKVNPVSGCLPILIQIPLFYTLWSVIPYLPELHKESFLWIKDLSQPDTVFHLNLIITNNINILPIIVTITTIIQTKLNFMGNMGSSSNYNNELMQYMLPLVFIFALWSMPSGLVLYWTFQNIFQILHQIYINKRLNRKTA